MAGILLHTRCCVKLYITQSARTPVYSKFTKGMVAFGSFPLHIQLKNRSRCVLTKATCLTSNCPRNRKAPFICLCFSDYKLAKKKCIYEKKIFFCFLLRNLQPDTLLAPLEDINMENIFHCLPEIERFIMQQQGQFPGTETLMGRATARPCWTSHSSAFWHFSWGKLRALVW